MLINLSDVLSEQHKTVDETVQLEMDTFQSRTGAFPIVSKEPVHVVAEHVKGRELLIHVDTEICILIPCDICLEILIGWPTKVLCSEDCKGICNVCGQNLNMGTCNCEDTALDPRMSVVRDLFKNFKEV